MKLTSFLATMASITLLAAATSCGALGNLTKKPTTSTPKTEKKHPASVKTNEVDVTSALTGEWQIVKVGSDEIPVADEMPYVNFDTETGAFYASNGCNILNGAFRIEGCKVEFDNVLSTMRACEDMKFADAITAVLSDGKKYSVEISIGSGAEVITLKDQASHAVMKLRKGNISYLNGLWEIVKIGSRSYDNPEMNIFIDVPAGKVHGNTGCNYFNGDIYQDVEVANSISFGNMGTTRMACPDNAAEMAMLVALEQVTNARKGQGHTAQLCDSEGNVLITLKYIQNKPID